MRELPTPPGAAALSELIKKRLAEATASKGTRETVTVEWNQQPLHVEVIDLPLSRLYFNPATHRIRAQRSHDPQRDRALHEDPYSTQSQDYLKFLLQAEPKNPSRRDPDFENLKESLQGFGQTDPGLVTHEGILVNGNTRAAALRELGRQSMRVGILPESFTWTDINAIELSLQLRDDHRREYSYINRMLAMEEQAGLGKDKQAIAKEFRVRKETVEQERWILSTIREQIKRSQGPRGAVLTLIDFEDHQEKLKELHRAYEKLRAVDQEQADVFKELRLAAITLGFAKTDVRHIEDGAFQDTYLRKELPEVFFAATADEDAVTVPGLGVSIPGDTDVLASARKIHDEVLQAKAEAKDLSGVPDDDRKHAGEKFQQVWKAFDGALDKAGRSARLRKRKQLAPARLADACADIDQCVVDLVQARASRALDEEAFDDAVVNLRESLRKLAHQAGRGIRNPGSGVSWLLEAASMEDIS
ncbi:transcriptional regulator [Saccharopolyspora shandongensis]|uniref:transcriptional regulator n=1 Tax=Saccharopolyspora shandongensis TaxID=418495 RepID=UPI00340D6D3A